MHNWTENVHNSFLPSNNDGRHAAMDQALRVIHQTLHLLTLTPPLVKLRLDRLINNENTFLDLLTISIQLGVITPLS